MPSECIKDELLVCFGSCVAREDQIPFISNGKMHIDHLDGGEFFDGRPGREPRGRLRKQKSQCLREAVGDEGDEDVAFNARLFAMEDRPDAQVALERSESLLNLPEPEVEFPQVSGVASHEV